MTIKSKEFHEAFARFFEKPTRELLRELLRTNVGELDYCDFKKEWPSFPKVARHILGLANSGGGCVVMGIDDDSSQPVGLSSILDKSDVEKGVRKYLSVEVTHLVLNFSYDASEYPALVGKKFQVVLIEDNPSHLPFVCLADGDGIRQNAIYVRRGTNTFEANHEELQKNINRRIETGYSSNREMDLQSHMEQLCLLYRQIDKYYYKGSFLQHLLPSFNMLGVTKVENPLYPNEDLEQFIVRAIELKKQLIEETLGLGKR